LQLFLRRFEINGDVLGANPEDWGGVLLAEMTAEVSFLPLTPYTCLYSPPISST
jgi:hypothetical protein